MSSALTLIVLGQAYFFGPMIQPPALTNSTAPIKLVRMDYKYTSGIGSHKVHRNAAKWTDARSICEEEGGDLAIVNSKNEANIIIQLLEASKPYIDTDYPNDAFIGFHDRTQEGHYETVNGESLSEAGYNEWAPGEPKDGNLANCGTIQLNGKLNDGGCDTRLVFVCELRDPAQGQPPAPTTSTSSLKQIPLDYTYVPGIGSHKVHSNAANWTDARSICKEEGGDLAVINSKNEANIIIQLLEAAKPHIGSVYPDYAIIGFHDRNQEGHYETVNGESLSEAGYNEWLPGEPNNGNLGNCGTIYRDGKLNDAACHGRYAFVCELRDPA